MSDQLCPDELLDGDRAGTLDAAGRDALEAHLAVCASCRLERLAHDDFAGEGDAAPGDAELLARAIDGALDSGSAVATPRRRAWVTLAVAATLLLGLAAAATLGGDRGARRDGDGDRDGVSVPPPEPAPTTAPAPLPPAPKVAEQKPDPVVAPKPRAPVRVATAEELYARANAARRSGATADALRLYAELARSHPRSREALTSRVAVARLLLDSRGDAAGALRELDAYLAQAPGGTLAEEALAGRAQCLGRLGRSAEERAAWQELLRRFPATVYRSQAEARLGSESAPE